jgi:hypothetical protein
LSEESHTQYKNPNYEYILFHIFNSYVFSLSPGGKSVNLINLLSFSNQGGHDP